MAIPCFMGSMAYVQAWAPDGTFMNDRSFEIAVQNMFTSSRSTRDAVRERLFIGKVCSLEKSVQTGSFSVHERTSK